MHDAIPSITLCLRETCLYEQVVEACMARLQEQAVTAGMEASTRLQFSIPGGPTT